ncbi:unnamed protein product [Cylicostephanus goldi]|uniref:Uncharacterized protein n=1 Tax=Cylicostephanus goldi TaxID=71465 RepID=A0A3P6Q6U0_CYLGO|nr:unnamed protein product [Cylicostephanus goldi]
MYAAEPIVPVCDRNNIDIAEADPRKRCFTLYFW